MAWNVAGRAIRDSAVDAAPTLLSALISATGDQAAATRLLRTTLALAEDYVEPVGDSASPELQYVESIMVQHEEERDASSVVVACEPCSAVTILQDAPGTAVRQPKAKRKRSSVAESMTASEARAQASSEGLAFVTSSSAVSGFYNVAFDPREKNYPYAAYGQPKRKGFLGSYATAEEAALAYARHVGNTVERTCAKRGANHEGLLERFTMVCRQVGCGALVDLTRAEIARRRRGGDANYVPGDGCGRPRCKHEGSGVNPQRFIDSQVRKAEAVLEGTRTLITWPTGACAISDKRALVCSAEESRAVAEKTLARFRKDAGDRRAASGESGGGRLQERDGSESE
jgi:hypothetical protein